MFEYNAATPQRLHRPRGRRRASSVPLPGAYSTAKLTSYDHTDSGRSIMLDIVFPTLPLRELDRRSRRRSLSRRNIKDMFHRRLPDPGSAELERTARLFYDAKLAEREAIEFMAGIQSAPRKPDGEKVLADRKKKLDEEQKKREEEKQDKVANPPKKKAAPCSNCGSIFHKARMGACVDCGFCGSPSHTAPECTVPRTSRCKCMPFPQYHLASSCWVTCSRPCGNPQAPGHYMHRNAMTCTERCCMCGLAGHSGQECTRRTCRCGGRHLGQDCTWNPKCHVSGCPRYLCGVHCRDCGSTQKPFVGWRCGRCLVRGGPPERPVRKHVDDPSESGSWETASGSWASDDGSDEDDDVDDDEEDVG
jgi:hypothetical protein